MQISNAEFCSLDVYWQIHLAAAAQILNVAVSTVFGAPGNRSCAFLANSLFDVISAVAGMYALRIRWKGNDATRMLIGADEFSLSRIPDFEDLGRGCTP